MPGTGRDSGRLRFQPWVGPRGKVAILDRDGRPLDGFGLEQCPEIYGDEIARTVSWGNGGGDLAKLKVKAVRLHFMMEDADLFSIQFRAAQARGG